MVTHPGLLLLALPLLVGTPAAAARDSVRQAVEAVEQGWREGITRERLTAVENLARHDDPRCVDALLDLLERGEVALFPAARRVLGGYAAPRTLERVEEHGLRHHDGRVREQVLVALGEGRPAGLEWRAAAREALDDPEARVRAAAVRVLGRARDTARLDRILALALDPAERVRIEVPEALARLAEGRAQGALRGLLGDPRWRVRLAAGRALADLRDPQAVLPLVDRLAVEPGRLREDLLFILQRLTGHDFELDIEAWKTFLQEAPPDFLKTGDAVALGQKTAAANASSSLPYRRMGTRYHTIPTLSERFVLVTDLSGSMDTTMLSGAGETPAPSRLRVAQDELLRLLGTLRPSDAFDLITFSDEPRAWRGRLTHATEHARELAAEEVVRWTSEGATNLHGALAAAFDMAEAGLEQATQPESDFDTLFLLSDGAPSAGAVRDADLLLQYVAERNRPLQLRIHCVSLAGEPECQDFLQRLAALGNGRYVELIADG